MLLTSQVVGEVDDVVVREGDTYMDTTAEH